MLRTLLLLLAGGLLLFAAMPHPARAQTPEPSPTPAPLPLGFHLAQGDSRHFEAARAAGAEFAVVVFSWDNIEPEPGYHYWSDTDAALSAAEYYGLEVIARLDQPPPWAIRPGQNPPFDADAYAAFAGRVAGRYGPRLAGIIAWNEPNLSLEWNDQPPDAAGYVALLQPAYAAIKAVAPNLPVALAAPASTEGEGDWAINDLDYLQALYAAGAKDYFDVLTAHPYGFGRPPDDAPAKYRPNFRRLELYRDIMAAHDDAAKPVWVTEAGWLVETGDAKSEWQLVSPQMQAEYILSALDYAQANYPWLERLALWQLNAQGDEYGFNLWNGPNAAGPAYRALAESCLARSNWCNPAAPAMPIGLIRSPLFILAPDSVIRLGDRDTLHPHWVHLYRNGSLVWSGEFFVSEQEANLPYNLLLETMQVTQPGNRLLLNGQEVGRLAQRPRPDITSTWVTQKFTLPPGALRPGPNTLTLIVGPRNPLRQYNTARFENVQMRHARLELAETAPKPLLDAWQPRPSPGGWSETARLRPNSAGGLWLTGNRPGQLWQLTPTPPFSLTQQAGNRPDVTFTDVLSLPAAQLAATEEGLLWRDDAAAPWRPVTAPAAHAYAVTQFDGRLWAGFEGEGLWSSPAITGPWTRSPLTAATVIDLLPAPDGPLFAASPQAIFATCAVGTQGKGDDGGNTPQAPRPAALFNLNCTGEGSSGAWQALPLPGLTPAKLIDNGEFYGDKMRPRLWLGDDGSLLVRVDDRLWLGEGLGIRSQESGQNQTATITSTLPFTIHHSPFTIYHWLPFGPEELAGRLYSVTDCCGIGTIVGTNKEGLWRLDEAGAWRRLDDGTFSVTDATEFWRRGDTLLAAGETGLFASADGGATWQVAPGLPTPVSALLADPAEPSRWVAGTPTGVFLSRDAGETWQPVSPPWTVWDMAFGPSGRLFVARSNGLAFVNDLSGAEIPWQESDDMGRVFFLRVRPNPGQPQQVWSGTWGNNIAASDDGGASVRPIHNGLETLSGLDLLWHATPGQVTLATIEGLYRTDNGGQSWFKLPGPLQNQTVHSLLQTEDGTIWAGAADGLWRSADFGVTWQRVEGVPAAAVVRLGRLADPAGWLWAGAEGAGLWLSRDGGQTWEFGGLAGRTVYSLLLNPARPGELAAATDAGIRVAETQGSPE